VQTIRSHIFQITSGVRHGSVLSLFLFAVYIDDICRLQYNRVGVFAVLYADDILMLALSVTVLQKLLSACEQELDSIVMSIIMSKDHAA